MNLQKLFCALLLAPTLALAVDTAYSPPVGGISVSIAGGTGVAPVNTTFAIPLLDFPAASGAGRGRISSLTANTIVVSGAGWTAGALAQTAFPYAVRIVTGSAAGETLSITGNTADTLTVSGRDLTTLGISTGVSGDVVRLIPVDTLNTLFGSNTFQGGATVATADVVTLSSSAVFSYYYNTGLGRWVRTAGPTTDRGNTPIPTDTVVTVTRKSEAMALRFTGGIPDSRTNYLVANTGSTYTHTGFPQDITIGNLAIQNRIAGWVSAPSAAQADVLGVNSGGAWFYYFFNGTYWQRTAGPSTNRDSIVIATGSAIQFFKRGTAAGVTPFIRELPYSL